MQRLIVTIGWVETLYAMTAMPAFAIVHVAMPIGDANAIAVTGGKAVLRPAFPIIKGLDDTATPGITKIGALPMPAEGAQNANVGGP